MAMFCVPAVLTAFRRTATALALVGAALIVSGSGAAAQQVIILVNGDPITDYDIAQRTRFLQLAGNKVPSRKEVIDELIDEKLKIQLTRRFDFGAANIDGEVETQLGTMARRSGLSLPKFLEQLGSQGIQPPTLKSRIKAEMIWTQVIRGKFQASYQIGENEILKEVESSKTADAAGYDYTLRPITFVIPGGAPATELDVRRREAEALRARFQNCQEGIAFARNLRDVTIREQVTRSSADLPPALREILEKTEVGKLTPPERTPSGVELYALCGKKESSAENSPAKRAAREKMYSKRFEANARKYLMELRAQAYCTTPDGRVLQGCSSALIASK